MNPVSKLNVVQLSGGEVTLWLEQGTSVHLRAVTKQGDPVELSVEEAKELAIELLRLAEVAE